MDGCQASYQREHFGPLLLRIMAARTVLPGKLAPVFAAAHSVLGVTQKNLTEPRRYVPLSLNRQMVVAAAVGLTDMSLPAIGAVFNRHHTTILSSVRRVALAHDYPVDRDGFAAQVRVFVGLERPGEITQARAQAIWQVCMSLCALVFDVNPLDLRFPGRATDRPGQMCDARLVALAMLARHARTRLTVTKALAQTAYATPGQLERAAHAVEARTDPDFREKVVRAAGLIASALSEEV